MIITWTIHKLIESAPDEPDIDPLYAICPNDDTNCYVVGQRAELAELSNVLDDFFNEGIVADDIDNLDERLGWKWLSVTDAAKKYNLPVSTVRRWAPKIAGALKRYGRWTFPEARFRGRVVKRERRRKEKPQ